MVAVGVRFFSLDNEGTKKGSIGSMTAQTTKIGGEVRTISVPEAGRLLGISQNTARTLDRAGKFPVRVLQLGRQRRVSISQLEAYLAGDAE